MRAAFILFFSAIFHWRVGLLAFLPFGFMSGKPVVAMNSRCDEPVYGVSQVYIDQRAETASIARDVGIRKAAEQAFSKVLSRVLLKADARSQFMTLHDLDDFSDFIHIVEENNLDQRYIATLDFCFDASRLRQAMITAQLRWAELKSPPILVIPVWNGPDGARAWHKDNQWIANWWDKVEEYDGLLSFRQLNRTLINERQFRGEDLVIANQEKLADAASIVRAEQVLLVMASLDYDGSKPFTTITAQLYDKSGNSIADVLYNDRVTIENATMHDFNTAREKIVKKMETSWHMANLIDGSVTGHLNAFMPVNSVKEWADRLTALDEIAVIQSYDIISLSTLGGQVLLRLAGSREALENALAAHGLELAGDDDRQLIQVRPNNG